MQSLNGAGQVSERLEKTSIKISDNGNHNKITSPNIMAIASQKKLITCCLGIFICYFYYGILQEKITKSHYGHGKDAEKFTYTISLVFIQCLINAGAAKMILLYQPRNLAVTDHTSTWSYLLCAGSYLGAMLASNAALQHVNYPTQVVGKSCKPIPVMILGVILAGKRYPLRKYIFILAIVVGVALFMYRDVKKEEHVYDEHRIGLGEIMLLVSLSLDGITGALQERMRAETRGDGKLMMYHINYWSSVILAVAELASGELFDFIAFVQRFPLVLFNIITFGLASAVGQFFIFMTVAEFGPLPTSIVTTTRKFFTVLASVIFFGNSLSGRQWAGASFVFTGLGLDALYGKDRKPIKARSSEAEHHHRHHDHHHHDRHHHGPHAHENREEHRVEREAELEQITQAVKVLEEREDHGD